MLEEFSFHQTQLSFAKERSGRNCRLTIHWTCCGSRARTPDGASAWRASALHPVRKPLLAIIPVQWESALKQKTTKQNRALHHKQQNHYDNIAT